MGRDWLTRLVARQAPERLHGLASEAACNASHSVTQRLAKWAVRLHCGVNGAPLHLTQADFAAILGVQRTSVNAAAGRLQAADLVRFGRGRVHVLDLARLRKAACGCGEAEQPHLGVRRGCGSASPAEIQPVGRGLDSALETSDEPSLA